MGPAENKLPENQLSDEGAEEKEYYEFVRNSAQDGSYFKDALDWYMTRYVNPSCDRTIMVFVAIIAIFSLYFLVQIINYAFPLVQKVPVIIRASDESLYTPFIHPLKDSRDKSGTTVDEAVAKYLLAVYVNQRESYDYRKSDVNDVNLKLTQMKNNSSSGEYKNFQAFMSKDNADSPINNFGRNIYRTTEVRSVTFIKNDSQDYYQKLRAFLAIKLPVEAEIRFVTITKSVDENGKKELRENYLAKVAFDFAGLDRNAKSGNIDFAVNNYKLFKIK